jgi:hypothetical protein
MNCNLCKLGRLRNSLMFLDIIERAFWGILSDILTRIMPGFFIAIYKKNS